MEANFVLWEAGARELSRERIHITLNKDCRFFFNGLALEALGKPDGVALMYDERRKIIGVMPSALNRQHAYKLRRKDRISHGRMISASNFCEHYEIKPSETLEFPTAAVNRDGILMLDLQTTRPAKRNQKNSG